MTAGPPVAAAAARDLGDRLLEVDTPENVTVAYPLADLGSRFAALLFDLFVAATIILGVGLAAGGLLLLVKDSASEREGTVIAFFVVTTFVVTWGYFFLFEALRDGQTPGKRRLAIRVVMDNGSAVTLASAGVRSLLRLVDLLGGGLVGGTFMLIGRSTKRLGDLAAGTIVVRELPAEFPAVAPIAEAGAQVSRTRLDEATFRAAEMFAERRATLSDDPRSQLAHTLAFHLGAAAARRRDESDEELVMRVYAEERLARAAENVGDQAGPAAQALLRDKRERWESFRALTTHVRKKGLASLGERGVGDFATRYRELATDLARARAYRASAQTLYALERLVGTGHRIIYHQLGNPARSTLRWFARDYPRLVRKRWRPIALAMVLLYGPALLSYALVRSQPDLERQMVPVAMIQRAEDAAARRDEGKGYIDVPALGATFMSSALVTNNVQVAFTAFAGGALAGVGSALVLVFNGVSVGSVMGAYANRGVFALIGEFVLPHGVFELTAFCIAGGGGMWMGSGLLLPGRRRRLDAFRARAKEGAALVSGAVVLLMFAALLEAFVSPSPLPATIKALLSALSALALAAYVVGAGRETSAVVTERAVA